MEIEIGKAKAMTKLVQVRLLTAVPKPLTYRVPEEMEVVIGDVVQASVGRRAEIGVIWQEVDPAHLDISIDKIKPLLAHYPVPPLTQIMRQLVEWVADYSCSDVGSVLKMVYSLPKALEEKKTSLIKTYQLGEIKPGVVLTPKRQKLVDLVIAQPGITEKNLQEQSGVGASVIKSLEELGVLTAVLIEQSAAEVVMPLPAPMIIPDLTDAQQEAAYQLEQKLAQGGYSATLLDGVTGSGKTEVYFAVIEKALQIPGAQILVMLPEIILTTQLVQRFAKRFGFVPDQWHSALSESVRKTTWRRIINGKARIIIGARSALFLPYQHLALIIVDEEHDGSYKQDEGVVYQARDIAIMRAHLEKIPVILASATPSVESVNNVRLGKYEEVKLPARFNASMPDIEIIDMRKSDKANYPWFSARLAEAVNDRMLRGEQVLLFLNRRGYAPLTLCRQCGHKFQCVQCSGWLVRHEYPSRLVCHMCGFTRELPPHCPECKAEDALVPCGPGVQRVAEAVQKLWPSAKLALMDSDHMAQISVREQTIRDIIEGKVQIIIGTQMIAKGHHFPQLSLVGIIDADVGLAGGDLRAAERCFQLLHQVSGRAGRESNHGQVLIQSFMPESAVIQALASSDRDNFVACELFSREIIGMPPFSRLVGIIISSKDKNLADQVARKLVKLRPVTDKVEVFGPVPAPLFVIRGQHRYRILVKSPPNIFVQKWIKQWLGGMQIPNAVALKIDVDPYHFF